MRRIFRAFRQVTVGCATIWLSGVLGCSLQDLGYLSSGNDSIENSGAGGRGSMALGTSTNMSPDPPNNLIVNPSFESGTSGWTGFGSSQIVTVRDRAHSGQQCLGSVGRVESWMGPSYALTPLLVSEQVYSISAWVRVSEGSSVVSISTKTVCPAIDAGLPVETYTPLGNVGTATDWVQVRGSFTTPSCEPTEFRLYLEGPPPNVDLFVDDISVTALGS